MTKTRALRPPSRAGAVRGDGGFFESNPMPMWVRNVETNGFYAVNDAAVQLYGYTREEFMGMTGFDLRTPEQHAQYREFVLGRNPSRTTVSRWRHRRKDGAFIDVEVTARGFDYHGRQARLAVIKDITESRRAEEALRESQYFMQKAQEVAHIGYWVSGPSQSGSKLIWSPEAHRIFGIREEDFDGRVETFFSLVHPEDLERVRMESLAALAGQRPYRVEHRIVRPDGTVRWVYQEADITFDGNGKALQMFGVTQDITERIKAKEIVASERNLLRSVLDALLDHVYVKDRDGRYLLMNAATRSARGIPDEAEIIGRMAADLLQPDVAARSSVEDLAVVSTGVPLVNREDRIALPSGEERWYLTTKVPLRDAGGSITGLIGINRDVTEIRKASEAVQRLNAELELRVAERTRQLELANQELESFAYSVSHDLRAPLRSIDGFSRALLEDYEQHLDADGRDYLRRVRNATQRMAALIDDLLALSRLSRLEMRIEEVDIGALARDIVDELRKQEPQRQVEVAIGDCLTARGDPSLLRVVMQNLLQNALKFTSKTPDARIEVGKSGRNSRPEFHVRDNGVGFDMAYVGRLFGAFQRLHADIEFPGTGIGLATVQRIIRRHGGEVRAEGTVGKGATIYFTLDVSRGRA